jgi:tetratricopeptide (TPR) repeat protein
MLLAKLVGVDHTINWKVADDGPLPARDGTPPGTWIRRDGTRKEMTAMRISALLILSILLLPASPVRADEPAGGQSKDPSTPFDIEADTAQWLVDLARHEGHLLGRGGSARSTSLHVIALLEGARQTDPNYAETYQWLYDLYQRMGRIKPAQQVLAKYVELTPDDEASRLRLLEMELDNRQTSEQRLEYIRAELAHGGLSPFYESELRRRLAKHFYEARENGAAAGEIEIALRKNPMNVAARELAYEMFSETEPALQRVEMALQLISVNPSQAGLIWDLADFLDRLSLHKEAQEWFNRAIDVHRLSNDKPIPADYWQKLAASYVAAGDFDGAKKAADAALAADPNHCGARLLRANIYKKLGDENKAKLDLDAVNAVADKLTPEIISAKQLERAAEVAWYYAYHHPDKTRSLQLSKIAMQQKKPDSLAKMAYGYALHMNGRTDDAIEVLRPLAAADQLAALELAKALIDHGDKDQAIAVLQKGASLQYSGIGFGLISDLLVKNGEKAPTPPSQAKLVAALKKFNRDVFDFYKKPGDYLKSSLRFEPSSGPLAPIRVTLRMENAGPFAITLGEGFMVRPLAAISARVKSQTKTDEFKNYLQVLINARQILSPGESVEKTFSIDVGPIREALMQNILEPSTLSVYALIDPVYEKNQLIAGLGTISLSPIEASRPGIDISEEAINVLIDQSRDQNAMARIDAAQTIAAVITAAKSPAAKGHLPIDRLSTALTQLLKDSDWHVRARAVAACDDVRLDKRITDAAAAAVNDENAVTKMLGVRLFAPKHGKSFIPVLEQLSKTDPNTCVRMMAASFLPEPATAQANTENNPAP